MDAAVYVALITSLTTLVLGLYNARTKATRKQLDGAEDRQRIQIVALRGRVAILDERLEVCERERAVLQDRLAHRA